MFFLLCNVRGFYSTKCSTLVSNDTCILIFGQFVLNLNFVFMALEICICRIGKLKGTKKLSNPEQ